MTTLSEILYTTWRHQQTDPTEHPSWGNLATDQRAVWDGVAHAATVRVSEQLTVRMLSALDASGIEAHAISARWLRTPEAF